MKQLQIAVQPNEKCGIIRNIAGINNSPIIRSGAKAPREKELFDALHLGYVRHHDAALENPGFALVDISRIFPLFSADENDPESYDFAPTDDYLSQIADSGCTVDFRLGESIEHSANKYRVRPPKDFEKWASICVHILRHYIQGWANGFYYTNIAYASVWEEANNLALFAGDYEDYLKLFVITYRQLRKAFPTLKIGGPNLMQCDISVAERYLAVCRENGIVPDFISQTVYANRPGAVAEVAEQLRAACDRFGFPQTEVCITEFHLVPSSWQSPVSPEFATTQNAAFTASAFILLTASPVAAVYYYSWNLGRWRIIQPDESGEPQPMPVYHAIRFFTGMTDCEARVQARCDGAEVLAGICGTKLRLLISCTEQTPCSLSVSVPGYRTATVQQIPDTPGALPEPISFTADGDRFTFDAAPTECTVLLMEFSE